MSKTGASKAWEESISNRGHSVLETMIHREDERHLVVQDPSNLLETSLALICSTSTVEVPPKQAVEFIIPKIGNSDPISIVACGGIREAKLVLLGLKITSMSSSPLMVRANVITHF